MILLMEGFEQDDSNTKYYERNIINFSDNLSLTEGYESSRALELNNERINLKFENYNFNNRSELFLGFHMKIPPQWNYQNPSSSVGAFDGDILQINNNPRSGTYRVFLNDTGTDDVFAELWHFNQTVTGSLSEGFHLVDSLNLVDKTNFYNEWIHFEIKLQRSGFSGRVTMKSMQNISKYENAFIDPAVNGITINNIEALDNLYVADDLGDNNNDFLGEISIRSIKPNGVGSLSEWETMNNLPKWQNVSDDNEETYIITDRADQVELFQFENISNNTTRIAAIETIARSRNEGIKEANIGFINLSSGQIEESNEIIVPQGSENIISNIFETTSNGNNWAPNALNSSQFGVKSN